MCCYLYAAWSLKRGERDGLTRQQAEAVSRWKRAIVSVAVEEMTHLALASNLALRDRRRAAFLAPELPDPGGLSPVRRRRRTRPLLAGRPRSLHLSGAARGQGASRRGRVRPSGRLPPHAAKRPADAARAGLRHRRPPLPRRPPRPVGARPSHRRGAPVLRRSCLADRPRRRLAAGPRRSSPTSPPPKQAIETIIEQGEGAPGHSEDSHYSRFLRVRQEYVGLHRRRPDVRSGLPGRPQPGHATRRSIRCIASTSTTPIPPACSTSPTPSTATCCAAWCRPSGAAPTTRQTKRMFVNAAIDLMEVLTAIGPHLASLPAGPAHPGVNAGVTFTMLRDVARLPHGPSEMRIMAERVAEIARHARHVFPAGHELAGLADSLDQRHRVFRRRRRQDRPRRAQDRHACSGRRPGGAGAATGAPRRPAVGRRRALRDRARQGRRHPLRRPPLHPRALLRAWRAHGVPRQYAGRRGSIPTRMPVEALVRVAHELPVGRHPVRAQRRRAGRRRRRRSTSSTSARTAPTRSAATSSSPAATTSASAPRSAAAAPRSANPSATARHNDHRLQGDRRAGDAAVRAAHGPRRCRSRSRRRRTARCRSRGNLEICSGTGRTIDRVTRVRLCRCGGSRTKPFCDNTHLKIGFEAPGD